MEWSVPPRFAVLEGVGAALFALAAVLAYDPIATAIAVLAAVTLVILAVRDVAARTRLTADADGLTVISGYLGHRRIPWAEVAAIRVDQRSRMGIASRLLEVDTGETVHLFSGRELGADPVEVAAALQSFSP